MCSSAPSRLSPSGLYARLDWRPHLWSLSLSTRLSPPGALSGLLHWGTPWGECQGGGEEISLKGTRGHSLLVLTWRFQWMRSAGPSACLGEGYGNQPWAGIRTDECAGAGVFIYSRERRSGCKPGAWVWACAQYRRAKPSAWAPSSPHLSLIWGAFCSNECSQPLWF